MKVEVKKFGVKSTFKASIFVSIIPISLMILIGILMAVGGAVSQSPEILGVGIVYIIMPVFVIFINGLLYMLIAAVYNALANKFGGLEVELENMERVEDSTQGNYFAQ